MKKEVRVSISNNIPLDQQENIQQNQLLVSDPKNTTANELGRIQKCLKQYVISNAKISTNKYLLQSLNKLKQTSKVNLPQIDDQKQTVQNNRLLSLGQIQAIAITRMGIRNYDSMENQDVILEDQIANKCKVYGIFDGHGKHGRTIALTAKNVFQSLLGKYSEEIRNESPMFNIQTIVKKVIQKVNQYILHYKVEQAKFSGTTALITLITANKIYMFNLGNSRAVLGKFYQKSQTVKSFQLTHDHTLDRFDQRLRISKTGAIIQPFKNQKGGNIGPDRIWAQKQKFPGIAITRSLGLSCSYKLGVSFQPEVSVFKVNETFRFLILASDGLWTVEENEEVVSMIAKSNSINLMNYSSSLIFEAIKRWKSRQQLMDDISLIVIPLIFQ